MHLILGADDHSPLIYEEEYHASTTPVPHRRVVDDIIQKIMTEIGKKCYKCAWSFMPFEGSSAAITGQNGPKTSSTQERLKKSGVGDVLRR